MIDNKYFNAYKQAIETGKYLANKEQVRLVEYLNKMIQTRDDIYFDADRMMKYIRFSEKYFFPLALYQKFLSSFVFYYWKDGSGVVFDEFLITLARGGGKNGWMSTLGAFFISPLHGVENYDVTITANSENQGKVSFEEFYEMVQRKGLAHHFYLTKMSITGRITNSVFKFRTNNPKTMDSARDGCLFFDEIHQFEDDRPVRVQRSGLGKVEDPRTFYFGTNGYIREGFYDKQLERAEKVLKGRGGIGFFPFICKLDSIEEMDTPQLWAKANPMFNENTEYSKRLFKITLDDYENLAEEPSGRQEFIVKRMNFTEGDGERDVADYKQVRATAKDIPDLTGRSCVACFDYASIRDFVSVGLLFKEGDKYIFFQHSYVRKGFLDAFKPKAPIEEWARLGLCDIVDEPSIDPAHVVDWLSQQRMKYQIETVCADGFRMDLLKPLLEKEGFEYEFIRNPAGVQAKVAPIIEDGFANERFIFGDDPMMRWYVNNTYIKEDKTGNRTFLKKEPIRRKTDGFHAFIAALYKRDCINEFDIGMALDMLSQMDF